MADIQPTDLTQIEKAATTEPKIPCSGGVPHTPTGRARSALNAIRHSLTGRTILLAKEEVPLYVSFCKRIVDGYAPANIDEELLAQTIADDEYRLRRFKTVEDTWL